MRHYTDTPDMTYNVFGGTLNLTQVQLNIYLYLYHVTVVTPAVKKVPKW